MVTGNILNMLLVEFDFTDEERRKKNDIIKRREYLIIIIMIERTNEQKIQVELLSSLECSRIYDNGLNPKPLAPAVLTGGPSGTGGPRPSALPPAR